MRIIIGDHNYNVVGDGEQFILVESKLEHPKYNPRNSEAYDFAILKLARPVTLPSSTAGLVCLPSDLSQTFEGATLTIRFSHQHQFYKITAVNNKRICSLASIPYHHLGIKGHIHLLKSILSLFWAG